MFSLRNAQIWLIVLSSASIVMGCGDDDGGGIDAATTADAQAGIDASGNAADAAEFDATQFDAADEEADAATAAVIVTANCTGIANPDVTVETAGTSFTMTDIELSPGDVIRFESHGYHNLVNRPGAAVEDQFSSGAPGEHVACLTFTRVGSYPFWCGIHTNQMQGDITVVAQ